MWVIHIHIVGDNDNMSCVVAGDASSEGCD